jgi:hypothetical protein
MKKKGKERRKRGRGRRTSGGRTRKGRRSPVSRCQKLN